MSDPSQQRGRPAPEPTPGTQGTPAPAAPGRPFGPGHQPRGRAWTAGEIARLGTAPDGALAASLGRSRASVIAKRQSLGIAAATGRGRPLGSGKNPAPNSPNATPSGSVQANPSNEKARRSGSNNRPSAS